MTTTRTPYFNFPIPGRGDVDDWYSKYVEFVQGVDSALHAAEDLSRAHCGIPVTLSEAVEPHRFLSVQARCDGTVTVKRSRVEDLAEALTGMLRNFMRKSAVGVFSFTEGVYEGTREASSGESVTLWRGPTIYVHNSGTLRGMPYAPAILAPDGGASSFVIGRQDLPLILPAPHERALDASKTYTYSPEYLPMAWQFGEASVIPKTYHGADFDHSVFVTGAVEIEAYYGKGTLYIIGLDGQDQVVQEEVVLDLPLQQGEPQPTYVTTVRTDWTRILGVSWTGEDYDSKYDPWGALTAYDFLTLNLRVPQGNAFAQIGAVRGGLYSKADSSQWFFRDRGKSKTWDCSFECFDSINCWKGGTRVPGVPLFVGAVISKDNYEAFLGDNLEKREESQPGWTSEESAAYVAAKYGAAPAWGVPTRGLFVIGTDLDGNLKQWEIMPRVLLDTSEFLTAAPGLMGDLSTLMQEIMQSMMQGQAPDLGLVRGIHRFVYFPWPEDVRDIHIMAWGGLDQVYQYAKIAAFPLPMLVGHWLARVDPGEVGPMQMYHTGSQIMAILNYVLGCVVGFTTGNTGGFRSISYIRQVLESQGITGEGTWALAGFLSSVFVLLPLMQSLTQDPIIDTDDEDDWPTAWDDRDDGVLIQGEYSGIIPETFDHLLVLMVVVLEDDDPDFDIDWASPTPPTPTAFWEQSTHVWVGHWPVPGDEPKLPPGSQVYVLLCGVSGATAVMTDQMKSAWSWQTLGERLVCVGTPPSDQEMIDLGAPANGWLKIPASGSRNFGNVTLVSP